MADEPCLLWPAIFGLFPIAGSVLLERQPPWSLSTRLAETRLLKKPEKTNAQYSPSHRPRTDFALDRPISAPQCGHRIRPSLTVIPGRHATKFVQCFFGERNLCRQFGRATTRTYRVMADEPCLLWPAIFGLFPIAGSVLLERQPPWSLSTRLGETRLLKKPEKTNAQYSPSHRPRTKIAPPKNPKTRLLP